MVSPQQIRTVVTAAVLVTAVIAVTSVGTITVLGTENDGNSDGTGNIGIPGEAASLDYKGCSEVWIILPNEDEAPLDADVRVFNNTSDEIETISVTITKDDLELVPGQYGDNPLFKFKVDEYIETKGDHKILAVSVNDSEFVENPNTCADTV